MKNNSTLTDSLNKVMGYENYNGLLIQRKNGKIIWGKMEFNNTEELDAHSKTISQKINNNPKHKKR